jgi:hypothetical protein
MDYCNKININKYGNIHHFIEVGTQCFIGVGQIKGDSRRGKERALDPGAYSLKGIMPNSVSFC